MTASGASFAESAAVSAARSDVRAVVVSDEDPSARLAHPPPFPPQTLSSPTRVQITPIALGNSVGGNLPNGAASTNALSALHAAGRHASDGSACTIRTSASCVVAATSPSVLDNDAKFLRITAPVFGFVRTSATAMYCLVTFPSSRCAIAESAAARTRGAGSWNATRNSVVVGDRGSSCALDAGNNFGQCA